MLATLLRQSYNKHAIFGLRHGVPVAVYVEEGLWQAMLARQRADAPDQGSRTP